MALNIEPYLPLLAMIFEALSGTGVDVFAKMALDDGVSPFVFVSYRQLFAFAALLPFVLLCEPNRPPLTWRVLSLHFLSALLGVTSCQYLFFVGLQTSSAVLGSASSNLIPAITFMIAVLFNQEMLGVGQRFGQLKLVGTLLSIAGAMLLSFFRGPTLYPAPSARNQPSAPSETNISVLGSILICSSRILKGSWFVLQAAINNIYPAPITSTFFLCFFSSVQSSVIALIIDHSYSSWFGLSAANWLCLAYCAFIGSALSYFLTSFASSRRGALYSASFSPLSMVGVAVVGFTRMGDDITLGMLLGSLTVTFGLYLVLYGKHKEAAAAAAAAAAAKPPNEPHDADDHEPPARGLEVV